MTKRKQSGTRKGTRLVGAAFLDGATVLSPVPADLWLACLDVYEAAALRMPVENPEHRGFRSGPLAGYVPKDIALNRGILAVLDFANDPPIHAALISRILAFGNGMTAAHADPRFSRFFDGEGSDGSWRIGEP
jgi:hypothetical protein